MKIEIKYLKYILLIGSVIILLPGFGWDNPSHATDSLAQNDTVSNLKSESVLYLSSTEWNNHTMDRLDVLGWKNRSEYRMHTSIKPFNSNNSLSNSSIADGLSPIDQFNIDVVNAPFDFGETAKKPLLKYFYRHPSYLYSVNTRNFQMGINPILHFEGGTETGNSEFKFVNTRGLEIRGTVGNRVSFYTAFADNQANFSSYINNRIDSNQRVIPGEGRSKPFKENAYDYLTATGYISFKIIPEINLQFGQDKNFIGNGYRSLMLSQSGKDYFFLKLQTQVWRIHYMNLFTEMIASENNFLVDAPYTRKYMAMHHLSIDILDNLNIGVFEGVVHGDTINKGFQLSYLNPIIFYRSIEFMLGSSDNVIIGMDWKYNFLKRFSFYGQFVLDEFKFGELVNGTGWWANKFGVQAGLKYFDAFGLQSLDLQAETNIVRPYTFGHNQVNNSYSQYGQPMAHPMGANFTEWVFIIRYQPIRRIYLYSRLILNNQGKDLSATNWGFNIFLSNGTREMDYDNKIGQGISTDVFNLNFTATYLLAHNIFADLTITHRNLISEKDARNMKSTYIALAFRMNIGRKDQGY